MNKTTYATPPNHVRLWMHDIGFLAEEETVEASRTCQRYHNKWPALKPVQFEQSRWYRLHHIKLHLNGKVDQIGEMPHQQIKEVTS